MNLIDFIFYGFMLIAGSAALYMVFTNNLLHAALGLLTCLLGMAGIFALLGAEFLAVTQIMVYAGGVIVLIIFGIMLTNRTNHKVISANQYVMPGLAIGFGFFILLTLTLSGNQSSREAIIHHQPDHIQQLGLTLLTEYSAPFEVSGVLLLVCLIASAFAATSHQNK